VLGQEAVEDKSNELNAIPALLERLAAADGLKGAVVTIDAIACNGEIATAIRDAGADYLLAVKANQPTLRREIEAFFADPPVAASIASSRSTRATAASSSALVTLARQVDWMSGDRRFPGELRLPDVAAIVRVESKAELKDRCRFETRYYVSSAKASAKAAAGAVRGHWGIENQLHWVLDVDFAGDQSRLRKGQGASNMAVIRHFAINLARKADEPPRREGTGLRRKTKKPPAPRKTSIKLRRKLAGRDLDYLNTVLAAKIRQPGFVACLSARRSRRTSDLSLQDPRQTQGGANHQRHRTPLPRGPPQNPSHGRLPRSNLHGPHPLRLTHENKMQGTPTLLALTHNL
jgi:predicted transposase YbfD/YdcC